MIDDPISPDFRLIVHLMPHWGTFRFQMRFTDLDGVARLSSFTGCVPRWWLGHYSYDDFSVEPLGSHLVRHALLDTQMTSCFLPRDPSWICEHDSIIDSDDRDYISVDAWLWCHLIFPTCHTFDAILGHISVFDWSFQIPTYLRDWPQLRDIHHIGDFVSFHHDSLMDFLLSRFIRLTLSDVSVTFGWSRLKLMDFHIIILSSTCQIFYASPSSYSWVIRTDRVHLMPYWGIFPSSSYGNGCFVTDLLQFSLLGREILHLLHWSLFLCCSSR